MPQINVGSMDRIKTDLTSVYRSELTSFFVRVGKFLGFVCGWKFNLVFL